MARDGLRFTETTGRNVMVKPYISAVLALAVVWSASLAIAGEQTAPPNATIVFYVA